MTDLEAWAVLGLDELDPGLLREAVAAVGALSPAARWPWLPRLLRHARHPSSPARAAVLRALAGAGGLPVERAVLDGLADGEPTVRAAAVDALAGLSAVQPAAWLHAIASPFPDVRRAAAVQAPEVGWALWIRLLADPDSRALVMERLVAAPRPEAVRQLVEHLAQGDLPPAWLVSHLTRWPWADCLDRVVTALQPARPVNAELLGEADPAALAALLASPDGLDPILGLLLAHGADAVFEVLLQALLVGELNPAASLRVAASALFHLAQGALLPAPLLAFTAAFHPTLLGLPDMPLAQRRAALTSLAPLSRRVVGGLPLARLGGAALALGPEGLDLPACCTLVALGADGTLVALVDALGVSLLVDAALSQPQAGAVLLRRSYAGNDKVEADRLVRLALQRGEVAAPLLGALLVHAPVRAVAALPRSAPASLVAPAVVGADALLSTRGEGPKEAAELAVALVARLSSPVRLLAAVLRESDASGPLAQQLVVKTLAAATPSAVVASLHAAGMARLARLDMEHGLLPDSVVVAFATAAARVDDADVRTWLAPVTPAAPDPLLELPPPGRRGAVSRGLAFRLAHSLDERLSSLVEPALAAPRSGLCTVLAGRPLPVAPLPRVCAAILLSDDPLPLVAAQLHRFSLGDAECLRATTRLIAHGFGRRADVGPGAALWLFAWPGPSPTVRALLAPPGACLALLADSLSWQGPGLRLAAWRAVASELSRRLFRAPAALSEEATDPLCSLLVAALVEGSAPGRGPLGFPASGQERAALQDIAAELLATLHLSGRDLSAWALRVGLSLPDLAPGTASRLAPWLSPRNLHRPRPVITLRTPPVADLPTLVGVSADLAELGALLEVEPPGAAECAALRLCQLGPAGAQRLLDAVLAGGPHARLLALALHLHGGDAGAVELSDPRVAASPPAARLALALTRLDTGAHPEAALLAIQAVVDGALATPGELDSLFAPDPLAAALALWAAPDPVAGARAVAVLVQEHATWVGRTPAWERDPLAPLPLALYRFLLLGADRPHAARLLAARALLDVGVLVGLPVLLAESMAKARERNEQARAWALKLPEPALVEATAAMMAAGSGLCPTAAVIDGLMQPDVDLYGREPAALEILRACREPKEQARVGPLLWLRRGRMLGTIRVADLFLWGRRQSRRLLGRALRIEMLAGSDLGWTRLDSPVIHVNPLPVLRGEAQGADIVRGLIVHELGHHLYNADAQGIACTKVAVAEGIGRLHNLVCDEHLERNLRTMDEGYGDDLKRLGAWAFQHASRGLPVDLLEGRLGPRLVPILVRAGLGPSRAPGQVSVGLGRLLAALEAHGSSFGRFVRALRMGRGDRHGDPRVEQALALFRTDAQGRSFRELDNEGLLEVSRALRRIFGDEAGVLDLCDLHGTAEPGEGEILADGEGVTGRDVQREVDRAERAQQQRAGDGGGGRRGTGGPDILSTGPQTHFERIQKVTVLEYDAAAHRALAQDVVRPARKLREVLSRLGLANVAVKPRVAGHRLDRSRLAALAIRRDPRVLVSRRRIVDSDLFIGVVVDCSGSMSGGRMERARRFAALLAEACRGLPGVDLRLFGFTDRVIYDAGTAARCAAHALVANGGNNDAAGLYHASAEALRSPRSARLLIMISDGLPTECTVAALTNLVQQLERRHGTACAQVAVHPISQRCFTDYVEVLSDDVAVAVRDFGRVVQRLVARTMRG